MTIDIPVPPGAKSLDVRFNFVGAAPQGQPQRGAPGIDVSSWQGDVDWERVKQDGKVFAGIRATKGATGHDVKFVQNWEGAKRVGLLRLPYHLFINNFPALPQLDNFLNTLGDDLGELPCVLDVEPRSVSNDPNVFIPEPIHNRQSNTAEVMTWLTECEKRTGKRPAIYTNDTAISYCTTLPNEFGRYSLWLAAYNNSAAPIIHRPWLRYMAWQHSSTGKVLGIAGNVDLDRWGEL